MVSLPSSKTFSAFRSSRAILPRRGVYGREQRDQGFRASPDHILAHEEAMGVTTGSRFADSELPPRTSCRHRTAALMSHDNDHARTEVLDRIFKTADHKGSSSSPAERTTNSSPNPVSKTNSGGTRLSEQLNIATRGCWLLVSDFRCAGNSCAAVLPRTKP
jgi:hypothetical protein